MVQGACRATEEKEEREIKMGFNLQDYETVEERLAKFWAQYPDGRVATELVYHDETRFIFKASVFRNATDENPMATGYAEERVDSNPKRVNFASAAENCETSSLGRALANGIWATKGKRPSREEMDKVNRAANLRPEIASLKERLKSVSTDATERKAFVERATGRADIGALEELTNKEVDDVNALIDFEGK
jgi:hypothetical protein